MKARLLMMTTLFLTVTQAPPVAAADASQSYEILGVGSKSCGAWTIARRATIGTGVEDAYAYLSWIQGFLTALNYTRKFQTADISKHTDGHGMQVWVDNYCAKNPLANLDDAAFALAITLATQ